MPNENDPPVLQVSAKQVGVIVVAIIGAIGSYHLDVLFGGGAKAGNSDEPVAQLRKSIDSVNKEIKALHATVDEQKASISNLELGHNTTRERQKILEEKMDRCQMNYAGIVQRVKSNNFLINECLKATKQ